MLPSLRKGLADKNHIFVAAALVPTNAVGCNLQFHRRGFISKHTSIVNANVHWRKRVSKLTNFRGNSPKNNNRFKEKHVKYVSFFHNNY